MSLPSPKRLRAGRQMLVEPCEIPFAGAPETLRSEAYLNVRRNDEGPARRQGQRRRWAFFSNLLGISAGRRLLRESFFDGRVGIDRRAENINVVDLGQSTPSFFGFDVNLFEV